VNISRRTSLSVSQVVHQDDRPEITLLNWERTARINRLSEGIPHLVWIYGTALSTEAVVATGGLSILLERG